ncbi:MAG: FBox-LRR protein [Rickettsiaceae bacterium]|jgi:Ran GTPase-activating protein (RanGAP) involved in mRNA processing and transport|nr:FBox-LRR protein [Rickettsiaceae bacterium]
MDKQLLQSIIENKITELNLRGDENSYRATPLQEKDLTLLLEALEKNTSITSLDLSSNVLKDYGVERLAKVLANNSCLTKLTHLNLSNNEITSEGASKLLNVLADKLTIKSLDISDNEVDKSFYETLAKCLEKNTSLQHLGLSKMDGLDKLLGAQQANASLKSLTLNLEDDHNPEEFIAFAESLKNNKTIKALEIHNFCFNKYFSNDEIVAFAEFIKQNTTLKSLKIQGLFKSLSLEEVELFTEALSANNTLRELDITGNPLSVKAANDITTFMNNNPNLMELAIAPYYSDKQEKEVTNIILNALKNNNSLISLGIHTTINDSNLGVLAEAIKNNTTLNLLLIQEIKSIEGLSSLIEALKANNSLYELRVNNLLEYRSDTDSKSQYKEILQEKYDLYKKFATEKIKILATDNSATLSPVDCVRLQSYKPSVNYYIKQLTKKGDLKITAEDFWNRVEESIDAEEIYSDFALETVIFDILGFPKYNDLVAKNNDHHNEYSKLYELFNGKDFEKAPKQAYENLKLLFITADTDKDMADLWSKVIHIAANEYSWDKDKVQNLIELNNSTNFDLKQEDRSFSEKEMNNIKAVLFHSLFPEYSNNIALTIEDYIDDIKACIESSSAEEGVLNLVELISSSPLPRATKRLVEKMINELEGKFSEELIALPDYDKEELEESHLEAKVFGEYLEYSDKA